MIAIVRNLDRFDGRSSFGTWVYRIATNASLDELRRRKRRAVPSPTDDNEHGQHERADPSGNARMEGLGHHLVLDAALRSLPTSTDYRWSSATSLTWTMPTSLPSSTSRPAP